MYTVKRQGHRDDALGLSKIQTVLLVASVAAVLSSAVVLASQSCDADVTGECGPSATYVLDGDGTLTIFGSGGVTGSPFNDIREDIAAIIADEGITSIGSGVFAGCPNLMLASLPGVMVIRSGSFEGCSSLSSIEMPSAIYIEDGAFGRCASLSSVSMPAAVSLGSEAFSSCASLSSVEMPKVVEIGGYSFYNCPLLEDVDMQSVSVVKDYSFYGCAGLHEIVVPSIKTIGSHSFSCCGSLTNVELQYAGSIGKYAFSGCTHLDVVTIPSMVSIGEGAFSGCSSLTAVYLPLSDWVLQSIGRSAFSGCTSLETIIIPRGEIAIDQTAFDGIYFLEADRTTPIDPASDSFPGFEYKGSGGVLFRCRDVEDYIVYVMRITLDKEAMTLEKGSTGTISVSFIPDYATNKRVMWSSSDDSVAVVSDGLVTAISAGIAEITAVSEEGFHRCSCVVTVIEGADPGADPERLYGNIRVYIEEADGSYRMSTVDGVATVDGAIEAAIAGQGKTIVCSLNGVVTSVDGRTADGDHFWKVHQWLPLGTSGWGLVSFNDASDKKMASGASYCLHLSTMSVQDGTTVYSAPDFRPESDGYVFIRFASGFSPDTPEVQEAFTADVRKEGFWLKGHGSTMAEVLKDAVDSNGFQIELTYGEDASGNYLQEWVTDMFGLGDMLLGDNAWSYWSQWAWVDHAWYYNDWTLGFYDPAVYRYIECIYLVATPNPYSEGFLFDKGGPDPNPDVDDIVCISSRPVVTFKLEDGTVIETQRLSYGDRISSVPEAPAQAGEIFMGWGDTTVPIVGDTTFVAKYSNTCMVRYYDESKTVVLYAESVLRGSASVYKGEVPYKGPSYPLEYHFVGWSEDLSNVVRDMDVVAVFQAVWSAGSEGVLIDGLRYSSESLEYATVVGYEGRMSTLVVPDSIDVGDITIPVDSIGPKAFYGCTTLVSADLGNVSKVDVKAFAQCTGLKTVHAGDRLSTISAYAFAKCTRLVDFDLGGSLKTLKVIGSYAFLKDEKLDGMAIPSFVTTIGGGAFALPFADEHGNALAADAVSLSGYEYINSDGVLVRQPGVEVGREFSWNGLTLTVTASLPAEVGISGYSGKPKNLVLSGPVELEGTVYDITSVMKNAFNGCKTLVSADLPGIERLDAQAFYGCSKLKSVSAPDLVSVGTKAFCRCTSLTDLDLGDSLTVIGAYGFWGCTSLESVTLPDTVRSLGTYAFQRCTSLSSIDLGESLRLIGTKAFDGTAVVSLEIPDTIVRLKEGALSGCSELREVSFEGGENVILHAGIFDGTPNVERIVMPDGFKRIYSGAFDGISFFYENGIPVAVKAKILAGNVFAGGRGKLVLSE
ncbi:MAG: leucine-rich repeat protein [Candidatus Methanomethylophilaceae archaeon]|nr:leucine-rich repeat protein [Candidatus Methanomethylophilaceae archaeon]